MQRTRSMLLPMVLAPLLLLSCGVEVAGTAATSAKLQADQAKQGKAVTDGVRNQLDSVMKNSGDAASRAEEADRNR